MKQARGLALVYALMIGVVIFHGLVIAPHLDDFLNWLTIFYNKSLT